MHDFQACRQKSSLILSNLIFSRTITTPAKSDEGSSTAEVKKPSTRSTSSFRPKMRTKSSLSEQTEKNKLEEKKISEEKKKQEAADAYKLWLKAKKHFVIRRTSPDEQEQKEVKW